MALPVPVHLTVTVVISRTTFTDEETADKPITGNVTLLDDKVCTSPVTQAEAYAFSHEADGRSSRPRLRVSETMSARRTTDSSSPTMPFSRQVPKDRL